MQEDRFLPEMERFDLPAMTGDDLKELGMSRVEAAANPEEMARIDVAILDFGRRGVLFTADDVRAAASPITRPNLIGSRFHNARRMGLIRTCGVERSNRRSRRSATVYRWRGTTDLDKSGIRMEEALAKRQKDAQLTATQKILDTLEGFSKKERAAILAFVLERFELGQTGAMIEAAEAEKARAAAEVK